MSEPQIDLDRPSRTIEAQCKNGTTRRGRARTLTGRLIEGYQQPPIAFL
jgi:hypothetical protein